MTTSTIICADATQLLTNGGDMNEALSDALKEIADIGVETARLGVRSKELRLSMATYYTGLSKLNDGVTACVFLSDINRLAFVKPVRKDGNNPESKIEDFTVTFANCDVAYPEHRGI